jgi:hypothetical protein
MFGKKKKEEEAATTQVDSNSSQIVHGYDDPLAALPKSRWERIWPAMACGSGLFSDGYINNVSWFSTNCRALC